MKTGLFSVSYAGYWGQESLDTIGFIRKAADLGYDGVLLAAKRPHVSVLDCGESEIDAIRTALDKNGLECIGLAAYTDFLLPELVNYERTLPDAGKATTMGEGRSTTRRSFEDWETGTSTDGSSMRCVLPS